MADLGPLEDDVSVTADVDASEVVVVEVPEVDTSLPGANADAVGALGRLVVILPVLLVISVGA
jgi:hypothetical protein